MATGIYFGSGDTAREVKAVYIGVDGVAREVTKGYIGDSSGKARLFYEAFQGARLTWTHTAFDDDGGAITEGLVNGVMPYKGDFTGTTGMTTHYVAVWFGQSVTFPDNYGFDIGTKYQFDFTYFLKQPAYNNQSLTTDDISEIKATDNGVEKTISDYSNVTGTINADSAKNYITVKWRIPTARLIVTPKRQTISSIKYGSIWDRLHITVNETLRTESGASRTGVIVPTANPSSAYLGYFHKGKPYNLATSTSTVDDFDGEIARLVDIGITEVWEGQTGTFSTGTMATATLTLMPTQFDIKGLNSKCVGGYSFEDWVADTTLNTAGFQVMGTGVVNGAGKGIQKNGKFVKATDPVEADVTYTLTDWEVG